jgi:hypothetical protein
VGEATRPDEFYYEWRLYLPHISSQMIQLELNSSPCTRDTILIDVVCWSDQQQLPSLPDYELPKMNILDAKAFLHKYQHIDAKTFLDMIA